MLRESSDISDASIINIPIEPLIKDYDRETIYYDNDPWSWWWWCPCC